MTHRRLTPLLAVAAIVLGACTGVPTSSSPEVVKSVGAAQPGPAPAITPTRDADPRTMVLDFLAANALVDDHHASAKNFLTPDAKTRWSDTTVRVVDSIQVGNVTNDSVGARGRDMGSISASGIYLPVLQGDGSGGVSVPFAFGMKKVNGQWRIDKLTSGLILSYAQFQQVYQQHKIYFYDLTETHLVPDPRYSSLTDRSLLANWLVGQVTAGPRPELQNAVTNSELPAQTDPRRVTVTVGTPTTIDLPGASQLDVATRNRLAGQLALTLDQVSTGLAMSLLDSGRPVAISSGGETQFSASEFTSAVNPPNSSPALFYIRSGAVVDDQGRPVPGKLGTGKDALTAIALASKAGSDDLLAAGTAATGSTARLLVGTEHSGMHDAQVRGRLSRPSWAPNLDEVWVGNGAQVLRVTRGGKPAVVPVAGACAVAGRVSALRFSPEGSRIALVLTANDGSSQICVGSVVRTPAQVQVRVDNLEPISPHGVAVTDVAWNDQLKLFTIGRVVSTGETFVYEVQVDGSLWTQRGVVNLPGPPDSITVSENVLAWVSVGATVWVQSGRTWASPNSETTPGSNPTYLE